MTQLHLTLFGTFQPSIANQPITHFPTDKVRALLAYLALEAHRPIRRETLATLFWPDYPNEIALRNLRQNLHRLKQTLATVSPELAEQLFSTNRATIQLNANHLVLDITEFQAALSTVENHAHRQLHTCPACRTTLTYAATQIQGDLLTGFSLPDAPLFDEWLTIQRERLHYQALQVLHNLAEIHLYHHEYDLAHKYAARQVALEPWREEAHRQIMLALAHQGRRTEALAHYETAARLIETEIGLPPSPETTTLAEQIANNTLTPIHPAPSAGLHHFPTNFTPFIGRQPEIDQIAHNFQDPNCRLLTLIAPGGTGKTRLAIAAAHQLTALYPNGIYFLSLSEITSRPALLTALTLAVDLPRNPTADLQAALFAFLAPKSLLLILDNFEQLLTESQFVADLLTAAPDLQILITSREPLNLQAEWRLNLTGLPLPHLSDPNWNTNPAVQLFTQTARRVQSEFDPSANQAAIFSICQSVQGLPLALEMAAAWVRLMPAEQIAHQIKTGLDLLTTTHRDIADRHRSIRSIFNQSWALLTPTEQTTLAQLSVFHGGFTLAAASHIAQATLDQLATFSDKALIQTNHQNRYDLHPLLYQFLSEKLAENPELAIATHRCHATYYLNLLAHHHADFHTAAAQALLATLQPEHNNFQQAWLWAAQNQAHDLLNTSHSAFTRFFILLGHLSGAVERIHQAANLISNPDTQAHLHYAAATLHQELNQYNLAMPILEQVQAYWQAQNNPTQLAPALTELGIAYWRTGDSDTAKNHLLASLELAQHSDDSATLAHILHHLGNIHAIQANYATALDYHNRSLAIYRQSGDQRRLAGLLSDFATVIYFHTKATAVAQANWQESLNLYQQLGDRLGQIRPMTNLAYTAILEQDYASARPLVQTILATTQALQINGEIASALNNLGLLTHLADHDYATAADHFRHSLQLSRPLNDLQATADSLMGLVYTATQQGHYTWATTLAGGIHHRNFWPTESDQIEVHLYNQALTTLRTQLPPAEFDNHWQHGHQMPLAALIQFACHPNSE